MKKKHEREEVGGGEVEETEGKKRGEMKCKEGENN